ncbi:periplasmic nitrate reductase, NapE protein [Novispirillum itersonii]|uniref:Nitrate reductase NapE protein n=1 Tax=Novispirillum itersonii TaxID=189 RepID=A0A7X0DNX6_NOVIT|nr:periplasmic nitrate reductase, NapE protein [Novispirillum itersonii]MBB6210662.1 nitrate reductase NapE protein [Novispirillum itersonii]
MPPDAPRYPSTQVSYWCKYKDLTIVKALFPETVHAASDGFPDNSRRFIMSASSSPDPSAPCRDSGSRRTETLKFLFLAFVLLPAISVGVVGAYGFSVWFLQMIYGPPGL